MAAAAHAGDKTIAIRIAHDRRRCVSKITKSRGGDARKLFLLIPQLIESELVVAQIEDIHDALNRRAGLCPKFHNEIPLWWIRFQEIVLELYGNYEWLRRKPCLNFVERVRVGYYCGHSLSESVHIVAS